MNTLQDFIEKYTNADSFFEDARPHEVDITQIELNIWDQVLNPCGMPRWYLNHYIQKPGVKRPEDVVIALEENSIHPVIAICTMTMKLWDVLMSLHDIQTEVIIQAGFLDVIFDKKEGEKWKNLTTI